jgi:hypothetical protein
MAAVHRLVLVGAAPELARFYPSAGGTGPVRLAWTPFRRLLVERADDLRPLIARPLQTNEVGRCVALLAGFGAVGGRTGLPLRLLELGASAGLNLNWDRYRFERPGAAFGPAGSPVRLPLASSPPAGLRVAERRGCDAAPLDPADPEDRLTLRSCLWADQERRRALLDAALAVAAAAPPPVDRADAPDWLAGRLASQRPGMATVVVHSIVWQYLEPAARERVATLLHDAGARATAAAPLAWLRLEPPPPDAPDRGLAELRLTVWPGGGERLLGRAGYHGTPVRLDTLTA